MPGSLGLYLSNCHLKEDEEFDALDKEEFEVCIINVKWSLCRSVTAWKRERERESVCVCVCVCVCVYVCCLRAWVCIRSSSPVCTLCVGCARVHKQHQPRLFFCCVGSL